MNRPFIQAISMSQDFLLYVVNLVGKMHNDDDDSGVEFFESFLSHKNLVL
jgi:hypothetical protein